MSAISKLNRALDAIEDAERRLNNIKNEIEDNTNIIRAIRELEDAEDEIQRAKRELNS
jgi:uncharacterized protein Yka (UPF0111/DUF47 family)